MSTPDPSSRNSRVLSLLTHPLSPREVAGILAIEMNEALDSLHSLKRLRKVRRVYPRKGNVGVPHFVDATVRINGAWLETVPVRATEALPSLSAKALLNAAVERRGLTQTDLAALSGISQPLISRALRDGAPEPAWPTIVRLLETMGYSLTLVDERAEG